MKMTGAQIICESLVKEGVEVMFGILGGMILPLYDTLPQY
ncbi:MAG: thiamine pyrophosphate-binding protein, partial [Chloroflexota bacterium]